MSERSEDPLAMLRRLAGDPTPSDDAEEQALGRLQEAVAAEKRPPKARRWSAVAAAAITIVAVAAGVVAVLAPAPVGAALDEIARAARRATPLEVPVGAFIYQDTESIDLVVRPGSDLGLADDTVVYLLPTRRQSWYQPEAGFLQTMTTVGDPAFFSTEVEQAYADGGGSSLDRVGETLVERSTDVVDPILDTDWPTRPGELYDAMRQALATGSDSRDLDVQLLDLALDILRTAADPQLRAAVIEVVADFDLDSIDVHPDGSVTITVIDDTTPRTELDATIAPDGTLTAESVVWLEAAFGIPANTPISSATHQPPTVVDDLP